ncbi:hypothetical protein L9F63_020716, partial [Diploptera punctata]
YLVAWFLFAKCGSHTLNIGPNFTKQMTFFFGWLFMRCSNIVTICMESGIFLKCVPSSPVDIFSRMSQLRSFLPVELYYLIGFCHHVSNSVVPNVS